MSRPTNQTEVSPSWISDLRPSRAIVMTMKTKNASTVHGITFGKGIL